MKRRIADVVERFEPVGVELIRIRAGDTHPLPDAFEDLSDEDALERIRHELKVERLRWEALMEEQLRERRRAIACKALDA